MQPFTLILPTLNSVPMETGLYFAYSMDSICLHGGISPIICGNKAPSWYESEYQKLFLKFPANKVTLKALCIFVPCNCIKWYYAWCQYDLINWCVHVTCHFTCTVFGLVVNRVWKLHYLSHIHLVWFGPINQPILRNQPLSQMPHLHWACSWLPQAVPGYARLY